MRGRLSYTLLQPLASRRLMTRDGSIDFQDNCCPVFREMHGFALLTDYIKFRRTTIDEQWCVLSRPSLIKCHLPGVQGSRCCILYRFGMLVIFGHSFTTFADLPFRHSWAVLTFLTDLRKLLLTGSYW